MSHLICACQGSKVRGTRDVFYVPRPLFLLKAFARSSELCSVLTTHFQHLVLKAETQPKKKSSNCSYDFRQSAGLLHYLVGKNVSDSLSRHQCPCRTHTIQRAHGGPGTPGVSSQADRHKRQKRKAVLFLLETSARSSQSRFDFPHLWRWSCCLCLRRVWQGGGQSPHGVPRVMSAMGVPEGVPPVTSALGAHDGGGSSCDVSPGGP